MTKIILIQCIVTAILTKTRFLVMAALICILRGLPKDDRVASNSGQLGTWWIRHLHIHIAVYCHLYGIRHILVPSAEFTRCRVDLYPWHHSEVWKRQKKTLYGLQSLPPDYLDIVDIRKEVYGCGTKEKRSKATVGGRSVSYILPLGNSASIHSAKQYMHRDAGDASSSCTL